MHGQNRGILGLSSRNKALGFCCGEQWLAYTGAEDRTAKGMLNALKLPLKTTQLNLAVKINTCHALLHEAQCFLISDFLIVYQSINKPSRSAPINIKHLIFKQTAWRDQFDKQWKNNYAIEKSIYSWAEMYCSNYLKHGVKSMQNHWARL